MKRRNHVAHPATAEHSLDAILTSEDVTNVDQRSERMGPSFVERNLFLTGLPAAASNFSLDLQ
jgi:hypothetical protein